MDGLDWFTIPRYHRHEGRESWFGLGGTFTKSNISARSIGTLFYPGIPDVIFPTLEFERTDDWQGDDPFHDSYGRYIEAVRI